MEHYKQEVPSMVQLAHEGQSLPWCDSFLDLGINFQRISAVPLP